MLAGGEFGRKGGYLFFQPVDVACQSGGFFFVAGHYFLLFVNLSVEYSQIVELRADVFFCRAQELFGVGYLFLQRCALLLQLLDAAVGLRAGSEAGSEQYYCQECFRQDMYGHCGLCGSEVMFWVLSGAGAAFLPACHRLRSLPRMSSASRRVYLSDRAVRVVHPESLLSRERVRLKLMSLPMPLTLQAIVVGKGCPPTVVRLP